MGKIVLVNNSREYKITAVIKDIPENSHLSFDMLGSFSGLPQGRPENYQWGSANYFTYLLMNDAANAKDLEEKIAVFIDNLVGETFRSQGIWMDYRLQPLSDVYLRSDFATDVGKVNDIRYIYLFTAIAILILVIACINYMNLATARAADRAKEVGMRKMYGAVRSELFYQFIGESAILTFISLLIAVIFVELSISAFNDLTGKNLVINYLKNPNVIFSMIGLWLLVSFLAGSYPALVLSRFKPAKVLKGTFKSSVLGSILRKMLVVIQFCVSIMLMIGTLVIYKQLSFIQNKKLGYDNTQVLALPLDGEMIKNLETFKTEFKSSSNIIHVTASSETPTNVLGGYSFTVEGRPKDDVQETQAMAVDIDFIKTLDIKLLSSK